MNIENVYLGDCLDIMPTVIKDKSIDLILCDLPYGTTNCSWDSVIDLKRLWIEYERVIKDNGCILLFTQTPFDKLLGASNLKLLKYEWIWQKTAPTGFLNAKKMPMKCHENILVFYKKLPIFNPIKTYNHPINNKSLKKAVTENKSEIYGRVTVDYMTGGTTDRYPIDVLKFPGDRLNRKLGFTHPTQKPLALCEYMIKSYTNENDLVLDNCAGSGTSLLAAKNLKRNYIGIEKEQKYYDLILKRLE